MTSQPIPIIDSPDPLINITGPDEAKFFDTEHLKADIKGHSVRGGAVTIGSQAIKFVLQTISTAVLARLLTKADFGLIAMVSVFTEFVNLFKDLGLSMATIQKKDITHNQVTNLFWINIAMSIFLMLVAFAISPLVARFYDEPRLVLITIAIGCTFIFGGLIAQHTALMRRQMRFLALGVTEIVSMAAGIAAAAIAALLGMKYWSLVIMVAVKGIVSVIMVWWLSPWRPGKPSRNSDVRPMIVFGTSLTASNIVNYFIRTGDIMVIGYALGPALLGVYTKAYALLTLPMSQINGPLRNVMIPALSRLQDEPEKYKRYYLQTLSAIALITMPLVTFTFVSANEIVGILLGDKWQDVVPAFRWLAPAAFFSAINFAPGWLYITLGRAAEQFRWALISAPVMIIGFLYGVNWGVNGVAASVSITYSIMFVLILYSSTRKSPVHFYDIVKALALPVMTSLLAAAGEFLIRSLVSDLNIFICFIIQTMAFIICYFICILVVPSGRELLRSVFNLISTLNAKSTIETNKGGTKVL